MKWRTAEKARVQTDGSLYRWLLAASAVARWRYALPIGGCVAWVVVCSLCVCVCVKLQALVYDILPSTTAIVDYAIGLEKLSANEQFFDDAQTAATL